MNNVNSNSTLRRNSLVSDHDDLMLLRDKLTRIAVGRKAIEGEREERRRTKSRLEHFKVFSLLPSERPNTPPSSPQPRDVLRTQLKLKQQVVPSRRQRRENGTQLLGHNDNDLETIWSMDEVQIMPMEDVEEDTTISSPRHLSKKSPEVKVSIPGQLRASSSFHVLTKHPEGWRKRKCVDVDVTEDGQEELRGSLKKTSSQVNILAASKGKYSRSTSAGGSLFKTFAARQRLEQDQEMEDVGCSTKPQSPENALFGNKHGQLSACS
ncbi:unnamed protein product [Peronospora farinosa]|uniref:Uncharacterized protein n=1 Tax=Peronospora farinosa TaxID=134698 RepID=A0AAV0SXE6_9STRA|nr:unnamed protein product [Peronospora farinosa]CAI5709050.1 unnamed protein product [Peronospora farinosa]